MKTRYLLTCLALTFCLLPNAYAQKTACACEDRSASDQLASARHIFFGEIQQAEIDSKTNSIKLRIQVLESYRGMSKPVYEASTALPDSCGIKATPGVRLVFSVEDDTSPLSVCHVPPRMSGFQNHDLRQALAISAFYDSNRDLVDALLKNRLRYYREREHLERQLFAPLNLVDPGGMRFISPDLVMYRDHEFVFKNGKLLTTLEP